MRELDAESADLSRSFDVIEELAKHCKFSDCSHTKEPGCTVLQALAEGRLEQRRMDSYLKLKIEVGYDGLSSKEIESKKLDRMFKDVGGIKGARDIVKSSAKHK